MTVSHCPCFASLSPFDRLWQSLHNASWKFDWNQPLAADHRTPWLMLTWIMGALRLRYFFFITLVPICSFYSNLIHKVSFSSDISSIVLCHGLPITRKTGKLFNHRCVHMLLYHLGQVTELYKTNLKIETYSVIWLTRSTCQFRLTHNLLDNNNNIDNELERQCRSAHPLKMVQVYYPFLRYGIILGIQRDNNFRGTIIFRSVETPQIWYIEPTLVDIWSETTRQWEMLDILWEVDVIYGRASVANAKKAFFFVDRYATHLPSEPCRCLHRSEASLICQIHLWWRPSTLGRGRIDEEKKGYISLPTDPNFVTMSLSFRLGLGLQVVITFH